MLGDGGESAAFYLELNVRAGGASKWEALLPAPDAGCVHVDEVHGVVTAWVGNWPEAHRKPSQPWRARRRSPWDSAQRS